jgi:hypothetical protein
MLANGITDRVHYLLENQEKLAVFADCHVIAPDGSQLYESGIEGLYSHQGMRKNALANEELIADYIVRHWAVPGPVFMCRKEAYSVVGLYDESLALAEDWDMYLRLAAVRKLGFLPRYVANYRVHPTNACSTKKEQLLADAYRTAKKHVGRFRGANAEYLRSCVQEYESQHPPKPLWKVIAHRIDGTFFGLPRYLYHCCRKLVNGKPPVTPNLSP